jgi:threonine synthase
MRLSRRSANAEVVVQGVQKASWGTACPGRGAEAIAGAATAEATAGAATAGATAGAVPAGAATVGVGTAGGAKVVALATAGGAKD